MLVDWVEGTVLGKPVLQALSDVRAIVGGDGWVDLPKGGYGYDHSAAFSAGGRVYWSELRPEMGVHVSIPSKALGCLKLSARDLLLQLERIGCKFKRVDFAFDDHGWVLSLDKMSAAVKSGDVVKRFKRVDRRSTLAGGRGDSLLFGSRQSESYVRIYDKSAEQGLSENCCWTRVELESKGKRADALVRRLLFNLPEDGWSAEVGSLLLGLVDFKEHGTDSNKSRWVSVDWWLKFLGVLKKSWLRLPAVVRTVAELRSWVRYQVAPSLFVLLETYGLDDLIRLAGEASERLQPKHLLMVSQWG